MSEALDEFLRLRAKQEATKAKTLAEAQSGVSPDDAARRLQVGRRYNVSPDVAATIPDDQHVREAQAAVTRQPRVGEWVRGTASRAALARGGMSNLADTSEHIENTNVPSSFLDRMTYLLTTSSPIAAGAAAIPSAVRAAGRAFNDLSIKDVDRAIGSGTHTAIAGTLGAFEALVPVATALTGTGDQTAQNIQSQLRAVRQPFERWSEKLHPETDTSEGAAVVSAIESAPTMLATMGAGAYYKSAGLAATLMGIPTGGGSYARGIAAGLSRAQSALYGAIDAVIEGGTELIPFTKFLPGQSGSFVGRMVQGTLADIPGEQIATFTQDLNQWAQIDANKGKTFQDFLDERPEAAYQTLIASLVTSGAITTTMAPFELAAHKQAQRAAAAAHADQAEQFTRTLSDLATASAVLQRDPTSFEEFVAQAADETGGPTEVFIEAAELKNVFDQSDLTVEQAFQMTGMTPEALDAAAARGEDVAIPIGEYASKIAAQPINEVLMPHLRLDPDGMSRKQAETYMQEAQDEFTKDAELEMAKLEAGDERATSRAAVEDAVLGQLNEVKRFNEQTNRVYASLVGAFFDTQSAKVGMTAEELAKQYGLTVQSGEHAAPTFDQMQGKPGKRDAFAPAEQAAQQFATQRGIDYQPPQVFSRVDPERATRIAQAYEAMQHDPANPEVKAAYDALVEETLAQYETIKATGLQIEFVQGEDPYGGNPHGAVDDVRQNNHIFVFSTEAGYGQGGISPEERAQNPMLQVVEGETWSGQPVLVNDVFRVVHDYFGHIAPGVGFRADGEENAWRAHSAMFSPLARRALTTETRGQNSWLNYGPHGEANRTAKVGDTVFADQKIGLMPEWTSEEGRLDEVFEQAAAPLQAMPMRVKPSGIGGRVLNKDLGEALTLRHRAEHGRALDPTDPGDYAIALASLIEDYNNQRAQPDNGEAWYSDDIAEAIRITESILPEIADPVRRDIFLTAVALLSPQQGPVDNWNNAIVAMTGYSITGRFADRHPDGTKFGVKSHSTGLGLFEHLINKYGEIGALVWLNSEHTGAEMEAERRASGMFKNKADNYLPSETNKTESKLGVYIFGPKVGDFMLNSAGLDQSAVTVDLWMARTYNRIIGRLTDVNEKRAAEGGLADTMRGKAERAIVKRLVRDAAEQAGIAPSAMQAALWYFEQRLYRNHGIQSDSTSFSDAAREAAERRGIPVDGPAPQGRDAGSDEARSRDLEEGIRVYNQSGVDALDAFKRESFYPSRAVRHEDDTVYADIPEGYPDRQARLAETLGAKAVVAVPKGDKRLAQGVALWHTVPPIEPDGTIRLDHWGPAGVSETDPTRWGESGTQNAGERGAITSSLPRTFFGIASGQPGGYIIEFPGRTQYQANVPAEKLYDVAADPDKLKPAATVPELERKIKAAGYLGYWTQDPQLGLVATVFEPLPVREAQAQVYAQDAVFFSALERAVERTATTKASAQQWEATLRKTPGIKEEELEWTGILEFLQMTEGPITREQMLEVVRGAGLRVDEVVLGRSEAERLADYGLTEEDTDSEDYEGILSEGQPQFNSWSSDPQNPTYRELLITLPIGEARGLDRAPSTHWDTDGVVAHARFMDKQDADGKRVLFIEEVQSDWHQKGRDQGYEQAPPPELKAKIDAAERAIRERKEAVEEVVVERRTAEQRMTELAAAVIPEAFASMEAQMRERAAAGTLTPEQVDSIIDTMRTQSGLNFFENRQPGDWLGWSDLRRMLATVSAEYTPEMDVLAARIDELENERRSLGSDINLREIELRQLRGTFDSGIPNAPFKTSWPALVMKRMIRYAAEHGYDKIAWTTGEQQAERYNLGGVVGRMTVMNRSATEIEFTVDAPNARGALAQTEGVRVSGNTVATSHEKLRELFGQDLAGRMLEADLYTEFEGDDLRVGGEGMKAFYDRNLVNITNGLIKKYGGKVGPTVIPSMQTVTPDEEFREAESAVSGAIRGLQAASALGGREAVQARIDVLRALKPGDPNYMEAAAPGYIQAAERLEAALPLYDLYEAASAKLVALEEAGRNRDVATGAQPGFEITPELADAAMGGFPLFQRERAPRGQIAFGADITQAPSVITLLRGADLSTFVHELGHFFFEVTNHMASRAGAPPEIVADRDAMLRYLGVSSVTEWEQKSPEQRREGHERMARSFEAYLFEGRAPSLELGGVFSKLRSWMLNVYRTITRLNVELTDEVRGVFDRMLASQEAIAEAEADAELRPLFTEKPEGMSDVDWETYQRANGDATAEAEHQLEGKSLRDMQHDSKAQARELKKLQRENKDQRDLMEQEVRDELRQQPVYRMSDFVRRGMLNGEKVEGEHRMDTAMVRDELLRLVGDDTITSEFALMTKKGGIPPQQVAEMFGYTSVDHMLKEIMLAPSFRDAVQAETDARMRERYGELNTAEEVEEGARAAVHNEKRGQVIASELAALQAQPSKKRVLASAARRVAEGMIARLRIRDLRPNQYEAAERRAAKAAYTLGADTPDQAIIHKRNQLLQFNLARAAHEAREETQKARDYLTKFNNTNTRKNIDPDFLDQIDQLLEKYELRPISNKAADRRKSMSKWIEQMQAEGFEPAIDPAVQDQLNRKPWRELTVEEMRGLLDAVKNIEYLGRVTKKLLLAKDKADLDTAANEMGEAVRVNARRSVKLPVGAKTWWENVKSGVADYLAMHRKLANLAYVFDGNAYGGVFWERFIRPMNERGDWQAVRNRKAGEELAALFRPIVAENTSKREYIPEIEDSLSLEDRLMVALNMGNEANLQRLMSGERWDYDQVQAVIGGLEAHHWDFVESVWRYIDSYWAEIAAKERRVSGLEPEKVEALPFQVEIDGQLRLIPGGYFPIKYDADKSSKADADESAEVLRQMTRGLYTNAQTRRGHTKERVAEVNNRPLRKDFGVIFGHVNQVIHDLAWHEYLIDANRLLKHGAVDSAIREHYGPETLRWMRKALEDIAIGDIPSQNAFEKSIAYLRSGVSIAAMGWSLWTSLLQPTGLTQSVSRIGAKHVIKGVGSMFANPAKMNAKLQWIRDVSPFMRERGNTMQREINEIRGKIGPRSPMKKLAAKFVPESVSGIVTDSYFYMIAKAQLIADVPTWLGQYQKSMDAGEQHDRAVAIADQAVIDSQGGGQTKDLAGVQRGSQLMRLFTNFYSYFSATMNLMADRTTQFRRVGAKDLPYYAVDMALLSFVPATIASAMYQVLKGDDDDDWEDWLKQLGADNLVYMLGLFVGVREIGSALAGIGGYQGPAGARFFAETGKFGKQVSQGEVDEPLLRATNSMAGILLHYPSTQLDRTVRGSIEFAQGDAGPQAPLVGPPAGQ